MTPYYSSILNKYIGKYGLFSPQEVIEADRLEKIWQDSQKNLSLHQLLEIFPEAKNHVSTNLKRSVKVLNQEIAELEQSNINNHNQRFSAPVDQKWIYQHIIGGVNEKIKSLTTQLKKELFVISSLKGNKEIKAGKITEADVAQAKIVPIDSIYSGQLRKVGRTLIGQCPFHTDKSPSFTIYTNTNRFWCFGCSAGGDSVDFIIKRNGCNFLEAIKFLLHK
jgi:hypothetical protein